MPRMSYDSLVHVQFQEQDQHAKNGAEQIVLDRQDGASAPRAWHQEYVALWGIMGCAATAGVPPDPKA